jgi:hypothetical protein
MLMAIWNKWVVTAIRNIYLQCRKNKAKLLGYPFNQEPFLSFSDLLNVYVQAFV